MSDAIRQNESLFNPILSPSGMFTCNYSGHSLPREETGSTGNEINPTTSPNLVFNPYSPDIALEVVDKTPLEKQTLFLNEYQSSPKIKLFNRSEFDDFALTLLTELVPNLIGQDHDLFLFPLRGCRQPGIVTKVIAGIPPESVIVFNYTYATAGSQQEIIFSQLIEQFRKKLPNKEVVSLGIIDTAKGGNGSIHLARVLTEIQAKHFAEQRWSVQFHLLHERDRMVDLSSKSYQIPDANTDSVYFPYPRLYGVESLLVEDWDDGIGISTYKDGKFYELKKAETPGRVIVRDNKEISLIESPDLSKLVTSLMVESVNDLMLDDPDVKYVRDVLEYDAGLNRNTEDNC